MKIFILGDTHTRHDEIVVPEGIDMLIHVGDFADTKRPVDNIQEVGRFVEWLYSLDIQHKVVICGNHDTSVVPYGLKQDFTNTHVHLLMHDVITIAGIKIFGSPYTPTYGHNWAFNMKRNKLDRIWKQIPDDVDIIITHGPPKGVLDLTTEKDGTLVRVGCQSLMNHVQRVKPKLHCFGHVHSEEGIYNRGTFRTDDITYINASCYHNRTKEIQPGIVYDYE